MTYLQTQYILHGQVQKAVSNARYFGVDISSNLKWNTNVDRIAAKVTRNIETKSPKSREMAYQSLVRPQLEYSPAVWDPHTREEARKIEKVQ